MQKHNASRHALWLRLSPDVQLGMRTCTQMHPPWTSSLAARQLTRGQRAMARSSLLTALPAGRAALLPCRRAMRIIEYYLPVQLKNISTRC